MKVTWSRRALEQLRNAHLHRQGQFGAAREFLDAVEALAVKLGDFPGMGVETDEPGVILFPLVRYLLFYEIVRDQEIRITRIRHASRRRP